jgi:DNA-binding MarR family transcriptional regulator
LQQKSAPQHNTALQHNTTPQHNTTAQQNMPSNQHMAATSGTGPLAIARLIDRVARTVQGAAYRAGLNPAQWAALRYFACANRFSRTLSAFARYHATSLGTASQTVKALVAKGLLERRADARDRRRQHLVPSAAGRRLLERDPLGLVARAAETLPGERRRDVLDAVEAIVAEPDRAAAAPDSPACWPPSASRRRSSTGSA